MYLILSSVPVTFVTNPGLARPSFPVMTHSLVYKVYNQLRSARTASHSLDQKNMARNVEARKYTAEIVEHIHWKWQAKQR
jgi:hypothetical protein